MRIAFQPTLRFAAQPSATQPPDLSKLDRKLSRVELGGLAEQVRRLIRGKIPFDQVQGYLPGRSEGSHITIFTSLPQASENEARQAVARLEAQLLDTSRQFVLALETQQLWVVGSGDLRTKCAKLYFLPSGRQTRFATKAATAAG